MPKNDIEHFNGNKEAYKEFKSKRERVLRRDKFRCRVCNLDELQHYYLYERGLDIHHIDGNPENNHMHNLLTICCGCHHSKHPNRKWVRKWGLAYHKGMDLVYYQDICM